MSESSSMDNDSVITSATDSLVRGRLVMIFPPVVGVAATSATLVETSVSPGSFGGQFDEQTLHPHLPSWSPKAPPPAPPMSAAGSIAPAGSTTGQVTSQIIGTSPPHTAARSSADNTS